MKIRCKKSKRFLCEINYEDIIDFVEKNNISLEKPLTITIPCRNCKESEVYLIYKDHYIFKENKNKIDN